MKWYWTGLAVLNAFFVITETGDEKIMALVSGWACLICAKMDHDR